MTNSKTFNVDVRIIVLILLVPTWAKGQVRTAAEPQKVNFCHVFEAPTGYSGQSLSFM